MLAWALVFGLCLISLGLAPGQHGQRRPHFWLRLLTVALVPACALAAASAFVPVWRMQPAMVSLGGVLAILAVMLLPALLFRPSGPPPGSNGDDGGGQGPEPPPTPTRPRGGIPLPDAEQARARVRDHIRPRLTHYRSRRPAREPVRVPVH
jgi:hypothetical protein